MESESKTFEEIAKKRNDWVIATRKNRFEDGIKRLLSELYPDNAHFIYELLQNAEDQQAKNVQFKLSHEGIEFQHDSSRLFQLKDVDSITAIGESTKKDDPTAIGKFGVGFKAVFAYTQTPEIHSGQFHFQIHDLIRPEKIPSKNENTTTFFLPFDNPKKEVKNAIAEIQKGLLDLNETTLLFLKHIHRIDYVLPDGSKGYQERKEEGTYTKITIQRADRSEPNDIHWLRYEKTVDIDDDGKTKPCRIAIAYRLERQKEVLKIIPLVPGQVSIYFPAENETSGLKFHIHAPFASTVARDSIRDYPANSKLRDALANLIVESFDDILKKGLLTAEFLAVLPNSKENLPDFYKPIRESVLNAFKTKPLVPTQNGGHAHAKKLYLGNARIVSVLSDQDLSWFIGEKPPLWTDSYRGNDIVIVGRVESFLQDLSIQSMRTSDASEFAQVFNQCNENKKPIEEFLKSKDDHWMLRFYALLGETITNNLKIKANNLKIVRDMTGQHLFAHSAFFKPERPIEESSTNVFFVNKKLYGQGSQLFANAKKFLEHIGVQEYNERTLIALKLRQYEIGAKEIGQNNKDIQDFIAYWKKNRNDLALFENRVFLRAESSGSNAPIWKKAKELFLDAPYKETGLSEAKHIHKRTLLWPGYKQYVQPEGFELFLNEIGVMTELNVVDSNLDNNPMHKLITTLAPGQKRTDGETRIDYWIEDLPKYIALQSIPISRLIWNVLKNTNTKEDDIHYAKYAPNGSAKVKTIDSRLVQELKKSAWIPNVNGQFKRPNQINENELRADFPYFENGILKAIGFGEGEQPIISESADSDKKAKEMGFSSAKEVKQLLKIAKLLRQKGQTLDELEKELTPSEFPTEIETIDEIRRGIKTGKEYEDASEKDYEPKPVSTRKPSINTEVRTQLRRYYTNNDQQLICQICKKEMPFKDRHGEYYFEAIEMLSRAYFSKEHPSQYLCLCPLCAAKYRVWMTYTTGQTLVMDELKKQLKESKDKEVPILLGKEQTSIRFNLRHIVDIRKILDLISIKNKVKG